jgi:hypothetical protein
MYMKRKIFIPISTARILFLWLSFRLPSPITKPQLSGFEHCQLFMLQLNFFIDCVVKLIFFICWLTISILVILMDRSVEGICNNLDHPHWGAAMNAHHRSHNTYILVFSLSSHTYIPWPPSLGCLHERPPQVIQYIYTSILLEFTYTVYIPRPPALGRRHERAPQVIQNIYTSILVVFTYIYTCLTHPACLPACGKNYLAELRVMSARTIYIYVYTLYIYIVYIYLESLFRFLRSRSCQTYTHILYTEGSL